MNSTMKGILLLCVIGIAVVLFLAFSGKCGGNVREGLGGGGGHGGGGGGRGGGGGGGGRGGGGRGGGGFGGGGMRGGGGRGGIGHGGGWGRGRGRSGRWWNGSGWIGGGYWPYDWYWDPYYYVDLPYGYTDIDRDPCNCFGKYKTAVDGGLSKEAAAGVLENCVRNTLNGGPCY